MEKKHLKKDKINKKELINDSDNINNIEINEKKINMEENTNHYKTLKKSQIKKKRNKNE